MSDYDLIVLGLCDLIKLVGGESWDASDTAAIEQARLYVEGVRDVRIADVTFQAVTLARMISQIK